MSADATDSNVADALTASIVAAYVGNNAVPACDLPNLIRSVRHALVVNEASAEPASPEIQKPTPAEIKKSITPDALISFIDGKPYKTLRRHLRTHSLTPESYRARYGLPVDYPTTAASYSAQRSALAKQVGLGQQNRPQPAAENAPAAAKKAKRDPKVTS